MLSVRLLATEMLHDESLISQRNSTSGSPEEPRALGDLQVRRACLTSRLGGMLIERLLQPSSQTRPPSKP